MLIRRPDCDVVVIGGGPAGAAPAAYLSRAGLDCVLLERELFPRPHVGESLVPAATRVFRELDLLEPLDVAGFPRKYGAVWTSSSDSPVYSHDWEGLDVDSQVAVRFDERQQPGVERNYTYHVDRGKFDLILLQHAHRSGARVYEGVRADRVDFSDDVFPKAFSRPVLLPDLTLQRIAEAEGVSPSYVTRLLRLAYLAPDIVTAIIDGRQPPGLTANTLMKNTRLPFRWEAQRKRLGFKHA